MKSYVENEDLELRKSDIDKFWKHFARDVLEIDCTFADEEDIVVMRKVLIDVFDEQIVLFKDLFIPNEEYEIPPISHEEIALIKNEKIVSQLRDE